MNNTTNKNYNEVSLDGRNVDRHYRHPMTKQFQYEYALYETVSDLFKSVRCRSMSMESLALHFAELPHTKDDTKEIRKGSQEDVMAEVAGLVARDVVGNITFPMMHICACDSMSILEDDGSHTFLFSDGIYGFSVRLRLSENGHPKKIEVWDLAKVKPVKGKPRRKVANRNAAHSAA
ncbi:MAG: hypothetical protein K6E19_11480 [Lachnospiraceae bacterium]|nr:hypothetical protein [Lachnospiraceae bacterium]